MARKHPVRIEDLFRLRAVGRPAISPDGSRIAFELKRFDAEKNKNFTQIMIADVASGVVRELTRGDHNDTQPQWSPDGRELAFVSDRDKGTCLFVLPMDGGERRRLTEPDGFVRDFAWSPRGERIAYAWQALSDREKAERDGKSDELTRRPQIKHITRLHHKLDGAGWWNGHYTHVYVMPSAGGTQKRLTSGDYDHAEPRFSPDGRTVSFTSNRDDDPDVDPWHVELYAVPVGGGRARRITRKPGTCHGHSWSPDGRWVAFVGNAARLGEGDRKIEQVWIAPAGGGRVRCVSSDIDNHCVNTTLGDVATSSWIASPVIWSPSGDSVSFLVSERGSGRFYTRLLRERTSRCIVGGDVNVYFAQRTARDGLIALSIGTATDPGEVHTLDPAGGALTRVTNVNRPALESLEIGAPQPFAVRNGKTDVHAWVLHPPGFRKDRKYPAILQIHGGPAAQFGSSFFHELQFLASRGYVVAFANPRGSTGYGRAFQAAIHADWGHHDYEDLMAVADWLFARPYVDRRRVGVTGGSYGGFMTNWIVSHTDRFRAAVTQRCVTNWESMFGTSDYGYDLGHEIGGMPWQRPKDYRRQSPMTFVENIRTPLLIEHEEQDHRCPIEQAEQLFTALKLLGRTVEMVRFEGESHGMCRIGRPQNRAERLRRIVGWFDRYMR